MKKLSILALLCGTILSNALPPDQEAAVKKALSVPAPEMPFVAAKLVRQARPAVRPAIKTLILSTVKAKRPTAVIHVQEALAAAVPAENRPPVTPGNEHGNRPTVPPGLNNYATP